MEKNPVFYLLLLPLLVLACKTTPVAVPEDPPIEETVVYVTVEPEAAEEEVVYSQELYDDLLAQVREFIEGLNLMIQRRDFDAWRGTLTEEHYARISSQEFLETASASPLLRARQIVLRTPNDYFTHVVVPSRANSRVDEIELLSRDSVRAFFVDDTRRLRLYELVNTDGQWKIAN